MQFSSIAASRLLDYLVGVERGVMRGNDLETMQLVEVHGIACYTACNRDEMVFS